MKSFIFSISNKNTSFLAHVFSAIGPSELKNNLPDKLVPASITTTYLQFTHDNLQLELQNMNKM